LRNLKILQIAVLPRNGYSDDVLFALREDGKILYNKTFDGASSKWYEVLDVPDEEKDSTQNILNEMSKFGFNKENGWE
jgi:hypothetical protein